MRPRSSRIGVALVAAVLLAWAGAALYLARRERDERAAGPSKSPEPLATLPIARGETGAPGETEEPAETFASRLAAAALERTRHRVRYDSSYTRLEYPGGDVPDDRGVCTDLVIRAYRGVGIDLQKEVHEDMKANFARYPRDWGLSQPDANIDHRRVPNLMTFFRRRGATRPATTNGADYAPGDIVCWDLGRGVKHIGIVINQRTADGRRRLVVHNIGAGPRAEDVLFNWGIIGHYRYRGGR